ncbi:hypothetical protein ABT160_12055 [Streptomyces sp. NPDC001941]|uniref:hypothetical protein n=1 Tax=Streptomyces sp. NPDC001941 TaxID=3154659 RepID=UPI00332E9A31
MTCYGHHTQPHIRVHETRWARQEVRAAARRLTRDSGALAVASAGAWRAGLASRVCGLRDAVVRARCAGVPVDVIARDGGLPRDVVHRWTAPARARRAR